MLNDQMFSMQYLLIRMAQSSTLKH